MIKVLLKTLLLFSVVVALSVSLFAADIGFPRVVLKEAISLAEDFLATNNVDTSKHHLSGVTLGREPGGLNYWDIEWSPTDKTARAGVIRVRIDMDQTAKITADSYRFRPGSIEFRHQGTRRPSFTMWMRIDDKKIPANYFVLAKRVLDIEVDVIKKQVKDMMEKDDGYVTVMAWPLNEGFTRDTASDAEGSRLGGRLMTKAGADE